MAISHSSWPWHRSDATALAGYANMMMMMKRVTQVLYSNAGLTCFIRAVGKSVMGGQLGVEIVHETRAPTPLLQPPCL